MVLHRLPHYYYKLASQLSLCQETHKVAALALQYLMPCIAPLALAQLIQTIRLRYLLSTF